MDEVKQDTVLDSFPEEVGLNESRRVEGGPEDVDAVVIRPQPVAVRVLIVRQGVAVRDALNLEG